MRDPARIDALLQLLGAVWHRNPDLRLGQLVHIAGCMQQPDMADGFYIEDDQMREGLLAYLRVLEAQGG